jgi:diacylglycerol kinase (ATP)
MPSTLVIYNPFAGRGRVQIEWPHIQASLGSAGVDFDAVTTQAPFEAITLAQKYAQNYARVVAVGGDGTINEVVNGLLRASGENETLPVGLIPLGNGDDFAKEIPPKTPIGGKPFDWHTTVEKIVKGETRLFDAGRMMGASFAPRSAKPFLSTASPA